MWKILDIIELKILKFLLVHGVEDKFIFLPKALFVSNAQTFFHFRYDHSLDHFGALFVSPILLICMSNTLTLSIPLSI